MLPRPATMVTAVVVTFAVAGVMRLSTRSLSVTPDDTAPSRLDTAEYQREIEPLETTAYPRASTPAVEAAQSVPAPSADTAMTDDLLRAIDELEALVQKGRSACTELGEPFYEYEQPGASGHAHIDRWNAFAREWDDDVSRAASRLPAPPAWNADTESIKAYQDISAAIREMRNATMGSGSWPVPFETEWSMRFEEALRLLGQSRSRLSPR